MQRLRRLSLTLGIVTKVRMHHDPTLNSSTDAFPSTQSSQPQSAPHSLPCNVITRTHTRSQSPTRGTHSDSEAHPDNSRSIGKRSRRLVKKKPVSSVRRKEEVRKPQVQSITKLSEAFLTNLPEAQRQKQDSTQSQTQPCISLSTTNQPVQPSLAVSSQRQMLNLGLHEPTNSDSFLDSPVPEPRPISPVPLSMILEGDEAPSIRVRTPSVGTAHSQGKGSLYSPSSIDSLYSHAQKPTQSGIQLDREKELEASRTIDRPSNPEPPSLPSTPQHSHWSQYNQAKIPISPLTLGAPLLIQSLPRPPSPIERADSPADADAETEDGYDTASETFDGRDDGNTSLRCRSRSYSDSDVYSLQTYRSFHSFSLGDTDIDERYSIPTPTLGGGELPGHRGHIKDEETECGMPDGPSVVDVQEEEGAGHPGSVTTEYSGGEGVQNIRQGDARCIFGGLWDIETGTREEVVVLQPGNSNSSMKEKYESSQVIPVSDQATSDILDQAINEYPTSQRETVYYSPAPSPLDVHVPLPVDGVDVLLDSPQTPSVSESPLDSCNIASNSPVIVTDGGLDSTQKNTTGVPQPLSLENIPLHLPLNSRSEPGSLLLPSQISDVSQPPDEGLESHSQLPKALHFPTSTDEAGSRSQLSTLNTDNDLHESRTSTNHSSTDLSPESQDTIVDNLEDVDYFVEDKIIICPHVPSSPKSAGPDVVNERFIGATPSDIQHSNFNSTSGDHKLSQGMSRNEMPEPIQTSTFVVNEKESSETTSPSTPVLPSTAEASVADDGDCNLSRDERPSPPVRLPTPTAFGVGTVSGPLPPGAAAPTPNVAPVILSIADALQTAISLNSTSSVGGSGSGNVGSVSGRSTPGTLPQIIELEEEEEEEEEEEGGDLTALHPRTRPEGSESNDTLSSGDRREAFTDHSRDDANGETFVVGSGVKTLRRTPALTRTTMRSAIDLSAPSTHSSETSSRPGLFYNGASASDSHLAGPSPTISRISPVMFTSIRNPASTTAPLPLSSTPSTLSNCTPSSRLSSPSPSSIVPLTGGSSRRTRTSSLTQSWSSLTRSLSFTVRGRNILRKREPHFAIVTPEEAIGLDRRQWDVEPWNGRNSGIGSLALSGSLQQVRSKSLDVPGREGAEERVTLLPLAVGSDVQVNVSNPEQDGYESLQPHEQQQLKRVSRKLSKRKKAATAPTLISVTG
ncbi:hypothetical protein BU17DRAFT_80188 [Hysterangium stoloniferum]|nr:hypothetical protein BU17DRAFT_80188 [Hysterangium stoloniferum]